MGICLSVLSKPKFQLFIKRRYRLSEKEMNEMSLQSALKHMLAACNAYVPEDINLIYYIDHPSSVFAPFEENEEIHTIDDDPSPECVFFCIVKGCCS